MKIGTLRHWGRVSGAPEAFAEASGLRPLVMGRAGGRPGGAPGDDRSRGARKKARFLVREKPGHCDASAFTGVAPCLDESARYLAAGTAGVADVLPLGARVLAPHVRAVLA
jgi:hypothetical protein